MIKLKQIENGDDISALLSGGGGVSAYKADITSTNQNMLIPLDAFTSMEVVASGPSYLVRVVNPGTPFVADILATVLTVPVNFSIVPSAPTTSTFAPTAIPNGVSIILSALTFVSGTAIDIIFHRQASAGRPDMTWKIEIYNSATGVADDAFVVAKVTPWV